jgi:phage terminase large subunit
MVNNEQGNNRELSLPLIELRDYQKDIWKRWFTHNIRLMMLVWHRRAGKDIFCLNIMIAEALRMTGNYWYLLPETQQVRNSIWEGITKEGFRYLDYFPESMVYKIDNQSMKVYLRDIKNPQRVGSIISFMGGDRYDKRVGAGLRGVVISELALQKVNLFDVAIEPMIKETGGWCIFNTTPRGNNHAKKMYDYIESKPEFIHSLLTIKDTGIVSENDLAGERERGKPEELIQQEYYCSFEGSIQGAYYSDVMSNNADKVGNFPYDARYPVHTLWDLGISDSMAIWFVQLLPGAVHVIDHYENSNYGLEHYAQVIHSKNYMYAGHHLPHDGNQRQLTATEKALTVQNQLQRLGLNKLTIHKRTVDLYGDIMAVRGVIPICYFNKATTAEGYESLKQYRREYDEKRMAFKNTPLHDWTSHSADAFRILPKIMERQGKGNRVVAKGWSGNFSNRGKSQGMAIRKKVTFH